MRYHYSLIPEDEPIIRDMPVYLTTTANSGTLLQLGATDPDSNADQNISLIRAASTTISGTMCVDVVGILTDSAYVTRTAGNVYASATDGANYGKVIINPFAVYLAEYGQSSDERLTSGGSSTTTLTGTGTDDIDGGWVYFTDASATAAKNNLRFARASGGTKSSATITMDSSLDATSTTSDYFIIVMPQNARKCHFNKWSENLGSGIGGYAQTANCLKLHIVENYLQSDNYSFQTLRAAQHKGRKTPMGRFYSDVLPLDHAYNNFS